MTQDIDRNIELINSTLEWASANDENFPADTFKEYRRKLKKIKNALSVNCAAAAYGESQVGKSYLMSSLLSSADKPFMIACNGKEYSFIDDLNPSGGANSKKESTGVITRFTAREDTRQLPGLIKVENFSIVDIILLLIDAYYNDLTIDPDNPPSREKIEKGLENLSYVWQNKAERQDIITEDDIKDIVEYVKDVIGTNAAAIFTSGFSRIVGPVIQYIPESKWKELFSLLWNGNKDFDALFETLLNAYKKINFQRDVFVPFDALISDKGTLLQVQWLNTIFGNNEEIRPEYEFTTDVYDTNGNLLAKDMPKGELSALIAEITFKVPEDIVADRPFLKEMDLLDFPGARSRERFKEKEIGSVLHTILRRGKVAYLFNKYSRDRTISSLLFCHHNDQKTENRLGDTVTSWIENEIGNTPQKRAEGIKRTQGISPFFYVATKFNMDMEKQKTDSPDNPAALDKHWDRFKTNIDEMFNPSSWPYEWTATASGAVEPFRNIYPLRDFYWSAKRGLFQGFSDRGDHKSPELSVTVYEDFPDYMTRLRESFVNDPNVRKYFADPAAAWNDFATLNNDGSKPIIRSLTQLAPMLEGARREAFLKEAREYRDKIKAELERRFEPDDPEAKNKKVKKSASAVKMDLTRLVGSNPMAFGKIIDCFMMPPEQLRNIAYEIIVLQTDRPKDFTNINFIKACAGIDDNESREENINRLLDYFIIDTEEELRDALAQQDMTLEDILSKTDRTLTTVANVVTKHIVDYWKDQLDETVKLLREAMPHADIITDVLKRLFTKLGVASVIDEKIARYIDVFDIEGQPNVIGDYASLTLNNFVSNVGRNFMKEADLQAIKEKAAVCRLNVDLSSEGLDKNNRRQPLIDTLKRLDESASIINNARIDTQVLRHLPFWKNYEKWQNFLLIGLICASDISNVNTQSNDRIAELIKMSDSLYA